MKGRKERRPNRRSKEIRGEKKAWKEEEKEVMREGKEMRRK